MVLTEKFEIKVFILYLLKSLNIPLDYDTISEIVVQDGFVNFFDFADCFADLVDAGQIDAFFETEIPTYLISETGRETVSNVETKVYNTVREQALRSAQRLIALRRDGIRVSSDMVPCEDGFTIKCSVTDSTKTLLNVEVFVTEERYAHQLRGNFDDNTNIIYNGIMALLSGDVNYIFNE